ncbi:MAG: hypothetical protein HOP15_16815 [Planctomycetes bacterium]|nr:hypothetical protein [Planctomycetota bacterium]
MIKAKCSTVGLAVALSICLSSCFTLNHTVGQGAQGNDKESKRVWFALWGLVPLSGFDSKELAGDAKDYDVETQWKPLDILINIVTGYVSFYSRTVTVTK